MEIPRSASTLVDNCGASGHCMFNVELLVDTAGASGPAAEALSYKECKCQSLQEMCVCVRSKAMEINEWMDAWMVLPAACCLLVAACCLHA